LKKLKGGADLQSKIDSFSMVPPKQFLQNSEHLENCGQKTPKSLMLGATKTIFENLGLEQNSEAKATNMVVVVVVKGLVPINQASNVSEFLNMARDGYGSLLVETVFFLCLLQKLHEERVVDVHHRNHEPLLLFSLTNFDRHAPFWHPSEILLLPITMVQLETPRTLLPHAHFLQQRQGNQHKKKTHPKVREFQDVLFEREKKKVTGKRGWGTTKVLSQLSPCWSEVERSDSETLDRWTWLMVRTRTTHAMYAQHLKLMIYRTKCRERWRVIFPWIRGLSWRP